MAEISAAYCPRCDRKFESAKGPEVVEKKVDEHVKLAHPEYDPDWKEAD